MYIDPQVQAFLDQLAANPGPKPHEMPIEVTREGFSAFWRQMNPPPRAMAAIEEVVVDGPRGPIPLRVYVPRRTEAPLPVLVFFHGGGCCLLSPEDFDGTSTALAAEADCIVVAPRFRQAPEHPFPAPLEDCAATYAWLLDNAGRLGGDPARIALAGDSGGGYLTAAVTLEAKRLGLPQPVYQVLIYPMVDMAARTSSRITKRYFLDDDGLQWVIGMHAGSAVLDPRASPLRAKDHSGLAPAMILACDMDPLADECRAYADVLRRAGVPTSFHCYEGVIHGFFSFGGVIDQGNLAVQHVAGALRHAFRKA